MLCSVVSWTLHPTDCSLPGSRPWKFSNHECWNGLPCPSPGDLLPTWIKPVHLLLLLHFHVFSLPLKYLGSPVTDIASLNIPYCHLLRFKGFCLFSVIFIFLTFPVLPQIKLNIFHYSIYLHHYSLNLCVLFVWASWIKILKFLIKIWWTFTIIYSNIIFSFILSLILLGF